MDKMQLNFDINLLSTENIKPSNPTPPHLKYNHPLSRLDRLISWLEYRTPLVSFYPSSNPTASSSHNHNLIDRLKSSLSTALSFFYPLAGRLCTDSTTIICNDVGLPLIIAQANTTLTAFLSASNRVHHLPLFLPPHHVILSTSDVNHGWPPLVVQLTIFNCGGIAIGSHVLHKASIDGTSRAHFFKTWAAITAGRWEEVVPPDFTTALSLFPPCPELMGVDCTADEPLVLGPLGDHGCIVKAFVFDTGSIADLQNKARSKEVPNPTRVQAVSAFLWKHLMAAALDARPHSSNFTATGKENKKDGDKKSSTESVLIHSVNMRPLIRPPLTPQTFGKFTTHAISHCNVNNKSTIPDIVELVAMIRKAIFESKDIKFVSKFSGVEGKKEAHLHGQKLNHLRHHPKKNTYIFSSWSGLDMDFGFGKPVWNGFMGGKVSRWFKNFVALIHVPGNGIEAWVVLDEHEMAKLESNSEFLAFASPNANIGSMPSPMSLL